MAKTTLYVESLADEGLAQILFAAQPVKIVNSWDSSGAISAATTTLIMRPNEPVAIVLGSRTENPRQIMELRESVRRLLARGLSDDYHVAIAVQRLLDWVLTDPRIRAAYEASPQDMKIYLDRANRVVELSGDIPFDDTHLRQNNEDYRGLLDFIHKHAGVPAAAS